MDNNIKKREFLLAGMATALGGSILVGTSKGSTAFAQASTSSNVSGIDPSSVLAKVIREKRMIIGYAQTVPFFQFNPRINKLEGIYYDSCIQLCREMDVEPVFVETTFANATLELRQGKFDLFGSSLTFTAPRAMTACFIGPLWAKGVILGTHRDNASRFTSLDGLDSPELTFSVAAGTREEAMVAQYFPKAKVIATQGPWMIGAEPVRAKKADIWLVADSEGILFAKRNNWVHFINTEQPLDKRANTWAIRYGDPTWKHFLDTFGNALVSNGFVKERFEHYMNRA
jgi:polar amino acid transport system substrate-binding protein